MQMITICIGILYGSVENGNSAMLISKVMIYNNGNCYCLLHVLLLHLFKIILNKNGYNQKKCSRP